MSKHYMSDEGTANKKKAAQTDKGKGGEPPRTVGEFEHAPPQKVGNTPTNRGNGTAVQVGPSPAHG